MKTHRWIAVACLCLSAFALAAQTKTPPPQAPAAAAPAREPGLYATLQTTMGNITVVLYEKEAPVTVKNFTDLAQGRKAWKDPNTGQMTKRPLYTGTIFHRVIPGFMIQGGDPTGTGMGDPGFVIPDEFNPALKFDKPGRLAMANAGPKTGNCQFFLAEVPTPHLNGLHTIFGQVIEGQDVVTQIARAPRGANDKPRQAVRITKVVIERVGPGGATAAPAKPAAKPPAKATTMPQLGVGTAPKPTMPKTTPAKK